MPTIIELYNKDRASHATITTWREDNSETAADVLISMGYEIANIKTIGNDASKQSKMKDIWREKSI